jgi:hypothetical protein
MNKTALFSVIGVVIVVALGAFLVTKGNSKSTLSDNTDPLIETPGVSGKKMAFSEFAKHGGSYKCTVTQYLDAGMTQSTQGTVYLDGGKIRGEYATKVQGMNIDTSVIVRDGFAYTWTSMMPNGYKIAVNQTAGDTGAAASGAYSWNDKMIGDYNCVTWAVDQSKFTLPSGVTFQEIKQ